MNMSPTTIGTEFNKFLTVLLLNLIVAGIFVYKSWQYQRKVERALKIYEKKMDKAFEEGENTKN